MNQENTLDLPSVLIVDDNVKNLQILGGFLQNEELTVEFAIDGMSALNWLNKKEFDLILLDIMMPGMDGYELCSLIKKNPATSETPIIFITVKKDSESVIKGFESGAVDYITRPFIKSELLIRVKTQLNIRKANEQINHYLKEIEERNKNISDSIEYASYIQNAVISTSEDNLKYLPEHFILFLPKDILSGDFYWLCEADNKLIIAVMDCTGHGVPGALMSILGITLLNEIILREKVSEPERILERLRSKLILSLGQNRVVINVKDGIEGSIISYNKTTGILKYSGSHNPVLYVHDHNLYKIKGDRIPIGFYEKEAKFSSQAINIVKGDLIYLFSDGYHDQFGGPDNKKIMFRRFKELIRENHVLPLESQRIKLKEYLNLWKGDLEQTDDISLIGIRF